MILSFSILRWVDIQWRQQASSQTSCRGLPEPSVERSTLPLLWEEFQSPLDVFGNDKEKLLQSRDRSPSGFKDWLPGDHHDTAVQEPRKKKGGGKGTHSKYAKSS